MQWIIALKPSKCQCWHQNLFLSSIPGAITVQINTLKPARVFINNSCAFLSATSCSAPVCVGMFMHEAFIIELWTVQIFAVNVRGDDSGMHIQLHIIIEAQKVKGCSANNQIIWSCWEQGGCGGNRSIANVRSYVFWGMSQLELTLSVKNQSTFILRSHYWFPVLSKLGLLVSMVIISDHEKMQK